MTLGEYLQDQRVISNLSQSEVAEQMGWGTPQFVSNIERDVSRPPLKCIKVYVDLIGAEPKVVTTLLLRYERKKIEGAFL